MDREKGRVFARVCAQDPTLGGFLTAAIVRGYLPQETVDRLVLLLESGVVTLQHFHEWRKENGTEAIEVDDFRHYLSFVLEEEASRTAPAPKRTFAEIFRGLNPLRSRAS